MAQKMKESPVDGEQTAVDGKQPGSPKSRLAMLKRSSAKKSNASQDPFRFQGQGVQYKGKLIGIRDVEGARGDVMCAEAMRQAKAAVKAAGTHKQRIILYINIEGIKIVDEKSQATLYNFPVSRISFIARDTTDARAFGFVFGEAAGSYKFYGIKTAQTADHAVLSIRDMFQIVFEMKKKQIEQVKKNAEGDNQVNQEGVRSENGVLVADLLDLETECQNIEQGLNQLANIPVVPGDEWPGEQHPTNGAFADPFGAAPFVNQTPQRVDPFADSFNSTNQSQQFGSAQSAQHNSVFHTPYTSPGQAAAFQQIPLQQQWGMQQVIPPMTAPIPTFSTTNPFADLATSSDPFDMNGMRGPNGAPVGSFQSQSSVNWGVNENTAPLQPQPFANFDSLGNDSRKLSFDGPRKVTSLEDAFSKLVDMDSLVGGRPNEAKKNPFEHIINPPKLPLNALGPAPPLPSRPVVAAAPFPAQNADPFSDAFFR
ncbi:unnamed protein product, partial [Mesorhabditis spiculigera]